ncbi:MAG: hypothetical protein RLZZ196_2689 [Bacteroidota bacterium]|jgi:hypothetical protein
MPNTIKIKNSGTAGNVPASLQYGELAINYADEKIYYKDSSNNIKNISMMDLSVMIYMGID